LPPIHGVGGISLRIIGERMRRILIIEGHPDGHGGHLCGALADAYAQGATEAGHIVRRLDLSKLDFPWLHSREEFENRQLPAVLDDASEAVRWAEHLVLVFPLWLGTIPALLKAFLEQVMRPGIAFEYPNGDQGGKMLLTGRSARIIVTMGMPAAVYRFWYFGSGINALRRNVLNFVGISPVRQTYFGSVNGANQTQRKRWLVKVASFGRRGI
jgi:putative NADPH-quinone reductase